MVQPAGSREAFSKLLFNAQHRLAVAAVLRASPGPVRRDEVAASAQVSPSVAHKELMVLVSIGAVQRVEVERSVYFQRSSSAFWTLCAEIDSLVGNESELSR